MACYTPATSHLRTAAGCRRSQPRYAGSPPLPSLPRGGATGMNPRCVPVGTSSGAGDSDGWPVWCGNPSPAASGMQSQAGISAATTVFWGFPACGTSQGVPRGTHRTRRRMKLVVAKPRAVLAVTAAMRCRGRRAGTRRRMDADKAADAFTRKIKKLTGIGSL